MDSETDTDTDTWFIVKATDPYTKGHRPIHTYWTPLKPFAETQALAHNRSRWRRLGNSLPGRHPDNSTTR